MNASTQALQPIDEMPLDELCISTIRTLAMDAVERAGSGHPGTPMALAPAAYALWTQVLRYNPRHPEWFDRDRFVLSNGHASMLLYALLHLTGFDLSLEDIKANGYVRAATVQPAPTDGQAVNLTAKGRGYSGNATAPVEPVVETDGVADEG